MNYRNFYLSEEQAEELLENGGSCYIVFEEDDEDKPKMHDLTHGIFESLEVAKSFIGKNDGAHRLYVADYKSYMAGSYDYL